MMTVKSEPQTFIVIVTMITEKARVDYRDWVTFATDVAKFVDSEVYTGTTTFSQPGNAQPAMVLTGHGYPDALGRMKVGLDELRRFHETVNSEIRVIITDDYETI